VHWPQRPGTPVAIRLRRAIAVGTLRGTYRAHGDGGKKPDSFERTECSRRFGRPPGLRAFTNT
jgi:hypothetical protein